MAVAFAGRQRPFWHPRKGAVKKQQKFFRNPSVSFADSVLNSQWSCRCARKLACGSPLLIGLIGSYCSHWLRCLFRPPYTGEPFG